MKKVFLLSWGVLTTLFVAQAVAAAEDARPNLVIILADDMGYGDCSVYNPESKISTPHIDQLAKEGLLFVDAHSASGTCTPSRYGLLTGINPVRTGVLNTLLARGDPIIAAKEETIATMLRDQGYTTRMIGKWHLGFEKDKNRKRPGFDFSKPLVGGPVDRGFDSFFGLHSSPGSSPLCFTRDRHVVALPTEQGMIKKHNPDGTTKDMKVMMSPGYRPEDAGPTFCREAISILREHAAATDAKPLFLYYASPAPHQPWAPSAAFKGKSGLGDYGDYLMQLDDVVGQINTVLKETGLDKNTLLLFSSDNGAGPKAVKVMEAQDHASSGPLRGQKADSWEGGHRIPFIVKWPGRIPANTQTKAVVNFTDLFATVAELVDVDVKDVYPSSALDSLSFLSVLSDPENIHKRQAMMIHRGAVRDGEWKLVTNKKVRNIAASQSSQFGLYNLTEDLSEQHDVSQTYPERTARLFEAFKTYAANRELK